MEKGIKSELGRNENALSLSALLQLKQAGTSVFDPFLVELMTRWYTLENDTVFDPFAGGSVRGVVTSSLNRRYIGFELRSAQVEANRLQAGISTHPDSVTWECADSALAPFPKCQFIFTCPPYWNMERYSDDPNDLSTMDLDDFFRSYERILAKAVEALDEHCFLAIMVGNVRKNGKLIGFPEKTVSILSDLGLTYHNELIYLQEVATAAMRAFNAMNSSRLAGSVHQKIYVFCKGTGKQAADRLGKFSDTAE